MLNPDFCSLAVSFGRVQLDPVWSESHKESCLYGGSSDDLEGFVAQTRHRSSVVHEVLTDLRLSQSFYFKEISTSVKLQKTVAPLKVFFNDDSFRFE